MSDEQKQQTGTPPKDDGEEFTEPTGDVAAQQAFDDAATGQLATAGGMVSELERERDANLNGWKQALADYANLKRESEKGAQEIGKYASAGVVTTLLPVFDSFQKAIAARPAPDADAQACAKWADGIAVIKAQLDQAFTKMGLVVITGAGATFDATLHEAMMMEPASEKSPAGTVVRVLEAGYSMNGRVLRPAKVVVAE